MRALMVVATLLSALNCFGDGLETAPQMTTVTPKVAKPGDTLDITGVGLEERKVEEVYLTDHKFDMRVKVLEQTDTTMKVRIPPFAKAGRMQILVLTKGDEPKLLEQPVYVLIEEPKTEIGQVTTPTEKESPHKQEKQ
jgi:IPT/TIG domain